MTNTKSTKRALLASVMALLLCFSMLLSTTFAWFTDSAASGSNVITAGNLDVAVEYTLDGTTWEKLDGADDLFQKGLWEPGHTEVVALKITNAGSLALKYAVNMNIIKETPGINKYNESFNLSEILTVSTLAQTDDAQIAQAFADEDSVAYTATVPFKSANVLANEVELKAGNTNYLIVKVDMAESVDNKANAKDKDSVPSIEFGLNVLATQFTYEEDSFGDQYDKEAAYADAYVTTADGLIDALQNGDNGDIISMMDDVKIEPANMSNSYGTTGINIYKGQTLDGNGNTLDIKGAGGTWDSGICISGGTVKNITVTGSFRGIFIKNSDTNSRVILENVITDGTTYTISCDSGTGKGLTATNCTFNGWTSYAASLGDAEFINCTFSEGSGYAYCRPYAPTAFVGCEFEAGFQMDPRAAVTFENCTLDGVPLTDANIATLVTSNIVNVTSVK